VKAFTALYVAIDSSTRTNEKLAAIKRYFSEVSERDAAWAMFFLSGRTMPRSVNTSLLRTWISEVSQLPAWLVDESYDAVGDLAETLALLAPDAVSETQGHPGIALAEVVETRIVPMRQMSDTEKRDILLRSWSEFDRDERLVWNKLITGSLRIGVSRTLVERALSDIARTTQATMAHRLMGGWEPTAEGYRALISGDEKVPIGQPYPFMLAYALDQEPESLGDANDWTAEWKWDGIRAQVIRRADEVLIWSRGEERVTDAMPEVYAIGAAIPNGTVLDGEILAWKDGVPLPFAVLQRRLNRRSVGPTLLAEAPVAFVAYDIMEYGGVDIRDWELRTRRSLLDSVVQEARTLCESITMSTEIHKISWTDLVEQR
jgi:DNA ligase 1